MKPKKRTTEQDDPLRPRLVDIIEREWAGFFPSDRGWPASSPRLVAGLLYLQHTYRFRRKRCRMAE